MTEIEVAVARPEILGFSETGATHLKVSDFVG
jgi:hypothetical protein